jgi:hypothetical protein
MSSNVKNESSEMTQATDNHPAETVVSTYAIIWLCLSRYPDAKNARNVGTIYWDDYDSYQPEVALYEVPQPWKSQGESGSQMQACLWTVNPA